jgi:glycosyltransferase involved in cell wall biosynthesis
MISFVIPVYRSDRSLEELHQRLTQTFANELGGFEIIFVEDCGGDHSWQIIRQLSGIDSRVRGFRMNRNYGQHNVLLCGIREAQGEIIVTLDDDLQHPPEEISRLLVKLDEGFDVVYGLPEHEQHGLMRNLASKITKLALESALDVANAQQISAFRAFRTHLRDAFADYRSPTVNIDVLLNWGTTSFSAVRVRQDPRKFGGSGYTTRKLLVHALNMMTGFSTRPLKFASFIGFTFALFGLAILAHVLFGWLLHGSVAPGFVFLACIISIFSGAQLMVLGVIGEYLARVYFRSMDRPPYLVNSRAGQQFIQAKED